MHLYHVITVCANRRCTYLDPGTVTEVRVDSKVEGHPERERIGEQEYWESNGEEDSDDLHLENREIRGDEHPKHYAHGNERCEHQIDDIRTEKVTVFVCKECVAMGTTLLEREPVPENLVAAAVWTVTQDAAEQGLTCPFRGTACEVNWALLLVRLWILCIH